MLLLFDETGGLCLYHGHILLESFISLPEVYSELWEAEHVHILERDHLARGPFYFFLSTGPET